MIYFLPIFAIAFAFLNRCRGSRVYNLVNSTVLGRVISMGGMAILASLLAIPNAVKMVEIFAIAFSGLMLWCTPAWDAYWGAEIGQSPHTKLWGCLAMFLRQLMIIPTFAALAYITGGNYAYCASAFILWIPYVLWGIFNNKLAIPYAEYTIGAIIGATIFFIAG